VAREVSVGELAGSLGTLGSIAFARPKIEHLHLTIFGQGNIRGFQIAVDDAFLMRRFQRFRELPGDDEGLIDRDRPTRNALVQALSIHQFEHKEVRAVGFIKTINLCDVRMVQRGKDLRFALEAR
jgi:hypothetical protein